MSEQRFPADFDGIVAGAPARSWTRMPATAGKLTLAELDPAAALPPAKLPALQAAAPAACGSSKS